MTSERAITIVGGGQAGTLLALGLQTDGWDVRLVQDRAPTDISTGRVMSGQIMFKPALDLEREAGVSFWEDTAAEIRDINVAVCGGRNAQKEIDWTADFIHPARSVDQRLKVSRWAEEFANRGGALDIKHVGLFELEKYARESALVIVATGKDEISRLFTRNDTLSAFNTPQRALALTYLNGATNDRPNGASYTIIPGVGEYINFPALTVSGPCEVITFEGHIGGPFDSWEQIGSPDQHLRHSIDLIRTFLPWEAERLKKAVLTDAHGTLTGRFAPIVRNPIGRLPSGRAVLGMADVIVLNDPIAGQGTNNATKCAALYRKAIAEQAGARFDDAWMNSVFRRFWGQAEAPTTLSNMLLREPEQALVELLQVAQYDSKIASQVANGFAYPDQLLNLIQD
jgi:hypothetical protein